MGWCSWMPADVRRRSAAGGSSATDPPHSPCSAGAVNPARGTPRYFFFPAQALLAPARSAAFACLILVIRLLMPET
jgi:hypothetical protein